MLPFSQTNSDVAPAVCAVATPRNEETLTTHPTSALKIPWCTFTASS